MSYNNTVATVHKTALQSSIKVIQIYHLVISSEMSTGLQKQLTLAIASIP